MPKLIDKPVTRFVHIKGEGFVAVTLAPEGLYFRQKGRKLKYGPLAYGHAFYPAVRQFVTAQKKMRARDKARAKEAR